MSVALLLITHAPVGSALHRAASGTLGTLSLPLGVMDINPDAVPEQELVRAERLLAELDQGDGILVMTDLYGSTPSNIACKLLQSGHRVRVISGVSLPMLIRTMNYPALALDELTEKALSGAQDGILLSQ